MHFVNNSMLNNSIRPLSIIFIALALLLSPINSWSTEITQRYSFEQPTIQKIKIDDRYFDEIIINGALNSGKIGHPSLPAFGARILIPYSEEIESIELTMGDRIPLGSDYIITPVQQPIPLSTSPAELPSLNFNPDIYLQTETLPEEKYEIVSIQSFRGYQILFLNLYPVEFSPASGELSYYSEMTLDIKTVPSGKVVADLRSNIVDSEEITRWVDNPNELATYTSAPKSGRVAYDMLIIAPSAFVSAFQPLKDYHDTTGVATEIHTLESIGANDPHSIRNYIKQEYLNNGIQYILIGADDDFIPALDMYVKSWESPTAIYEYDMPGDIYFACLDGTYNYDGDGLWGEPTDGDGGGEIDLIAEVNIGRFTANTVQDVSNLVNKTLAYTASEAQYLDKILISGEDLGFGGLGEYGGYAMEEMVGYSDAHGFLTFAFPEDQYTIDKLYDLTSMPYNNWYGSEMIAKINSGYHIIDHLGHSDNGYAMRTDTTAIKNQLSNSEYCFVYAEGCNAGKFDIPNCWAEYMTTKLSTGAFGCIANSRVGLGSRSTAHPVHLFNREFWDAIYNAEEAKPQLGKALSDCRVDWVSYINSSGIRWNYYEINLFGDPALAIKSVRSVAISYPDGTPGHITPYVETSFNVRATGIGSGEPTPESGQLHCAVNDGVIVSEDMTEFATNTYEATLPAIGCNDIISYYTTVDENSGGTYFSPNPDASMSAVPVTDSITIFNDDFETDLGWSSSGLWARGIPTGQGGAEMQYPVADPTEGCNGANIYGYNLNGDYENGLPATNLTSPVIDCKDYDNVHLNYCRWLGVEQPVYDKATVQVSTNGTTWTDIWANYAIIGDLEWQQLEYDISDLAAGQETVYLRWVMGPTDGGYRFCGWNIDDVKLVSYLCQGFMCGDANNDTELNIIDITYVINYLYQSGPAPDLIQKADVNDDGSVNILDVSSLIAFLYMQGPEPNCP